MEICLIMLIAVLKLIIHPVMKNLTRGLASKSSTVNKEGLGEAYSMSKGLFIITETRVSLLINKINLDVSFHIVKSNSHYLPHCMKPL